MGIQADGSVVCEKCGAVLTEQDWPFCPHGKTGNYTSFRDEIPGGVTLENYGPKPITFYSHSERRTYMKAHGLAELEKCCPFPGTDKDPMGIPNPAGYLDTVTMENRRILALRAAGVRDTDSVDGVLRGSFNLSGTKRDAVAVGGGDTKRSSRIGRRIKHATTTDAGS